MLFITSAAAAAASGSGGLVGLVGLLGVVSVVRVVRVLGLGLLWRGVGGWGACDCGEYGGLMLPINLAETRTSTAHVHVAQSTQSQQELVGCC